MTSTASGTTAAALAPVAAAERIDALDVIRGFALIGIFLMNVEWFTRPFAEFGTGVDARQTGLSYVASWFVYTFVQGKFWTMFSLLFGMGFAVMLTRAQEGAREFVVPYLRRIAALFVFGCAHYLLVWNGDILHNYAVAALFLLLIVTRSWLGWLATLLSTVAIGYGYGVEWLAVSLAFVAVAAGATFLLKRFEIDRWYKVAALVAIAVLAAVSLGPTAGEMSGTSGLLALVAVLMYVLNRGSVARFWKWGVGIFILPFLIMLGAVGYFAAFPDKTPGQGPEAAQQRAERTTVRKQEHAKELKVFTTGSYADSLQWRAEFFRKDIAGTAMMSVLALPMFMIGFWFVRSGVVREWRKNLPLFRRLATWSLPLGLALTLASVAVTPSFVRGTGFNNSYMLANALFELGSLPLCLGYVGMLFWLLGTATGARVLTPLRHAGRMALTNYLGASIIGTWFFAGYGLGYYGAVPRAGQVLFVAVVFSAQLAFSALWLSRFRYGPMEWLWRAVTYWQLPTMRRERAPAALPLAATSGA